MSDSAKKKTTLIRYLLEGTMNSLYEAVVENKETFSLKAHAAELLAKGYEILESDLPQGDFEKNLKNKTYTVYVREGVSIVRSDQPKSAGDPVKGHKDQVWPAGLEAADLTAKRSRHIIYQYEDGSQALPPVVETIEFERSAMVNHVTGHVSYMPWQAIGEGEFTDVTTPKIPRYVADILAVAAEEAVDLEATSDQDIVVTFSKQKQFVHIEVVEASSGEVLFGDDLEGDAGEVIEYPFTKLIDQYRAKGYEVQQNPFATEQRFGQTEEQHQTMRITLRPREVSIYRGELPQTGQPVYPELENSVLWPKGVQESKLRRLVTRTIVNQNEEGQVINTIEQSVEFRRPAKINLLTQEVVYGDWELVSSKAVFPAYIPEKLAGHTPRPRQLPELTAITADSANLKEVIVYTRQIQRVNLSFVDRSQGDLILYQSQLVGKTGEPIRFDYKRKIQEFLNIGYEVVENDFPDDATFTLEVAKKATYTIAFEPKTLVVSSKEPKVAGRFIDDNAKDGPKWPVGVEEKDLCHRVTRTIHYRYENKKTARESHVDTILFERDAEINLVSGYVSYGPWISQETFFTEHHVPRIDGYYANRDKIDGIDNITVTSADFETTVYYIRTSNQVSYSIIDMTTDEVLETKLVNGRSIQKLREEIDRKVQPYLAKGYQLENSQRLNLALKNPETTELTIELSQNVREVTSEHPKQTYGLVDGYSRLNWPKGLEAEQLSKTITRRVQLNYANGEEVSGPIVQEVTFNRTAQVNLVTSDVTYSDWTATKTFFPAVELPELEGYRANIDRLPQENVDAEELDRLIEVVYHLQPARLEVIYQDEVSKKELARDEFSAQVGETFEYSAESRLSLLELSAYEVVETDCPEKLTFETEKQTYQVTVKPKTVTVTSEHPYQANTTSLLEGYGLFNWPSGLDRESLVADVCRVISYQTDQGELLVENKIEQRARLTRSASVNLATREVSYEPWVSELARFKAVESPEFEGLVPTLKTVPSLELKEADQFINRFQEVVVTYSPTPYQAEFKFVDSLRQEALGDVTVTVLEKEDVAKAYQELLENYQQLGYVRMEGQELELTDWTVAKPKVFEISLKPQLMSVSIDHIESQFASFDEEIASQLQSLEGLSRLDLSREIKRTIKYLYSNGKQVARAYTDNVLFKRSARVNLVTGEIFYDDWMSYYPVFDEVLSPVIDDYSPSKEVVEAIEQVTADSQDVIETITYTRNVQQVVVSVVDKATGNIIYAESITGTSGVADTSYEVSKFVKKGKELVSDDSKAPVVEPEVAIRKPEVTELEEAEDRPSETVQTVEKVAEAPIKPIQEEPKPAKKPSVIKKAFSGTKKADAKEVLVSYKDVELHKDYGLTVSDLARTVTREIHFTDENGKELKQSKTQSVTFQRQAKVSTASKVATFTDWEAIGAKGFPKVTSPQIPGFEASEIEIPAKVPDPDGETYVNLRVIYTANSYSTVSVVFVDQESGEDIMNFTFADKGADYCEKKIKKGESFLDYKGYEVVTSSYPDKGKVVDGDTMLYEITVRKVDGDDSNNSETTRDDVTVDPKKLRDGSSQKPGLGDRARTPFSDDAKPSEEWPSKTPHKEGKQKGLFNFLFKD